MPLLQEQSLSDASRRGYTIDDLRDALADLDIHRGDVLMMHSSLYHLGRLHGVAIRDIPGVVVDCLRRYLGPDGTLAVPAPNWDYGAKRLPFDLSTNPVTRALGVISAHIFGLPDRRRSANPIFSVAAIGARASNNCDGYSTNAFG